ncbi:MAG: DNA repair protein RecO [Bacteroidaceae bacterium]|nr:DNA repair protein RecO [Bacteroidaceae bacterium]
MEQSRGIVLHALRYGDNQMVVSVFTETCGTVSFMLRQPQSGKRNGPRAVMWQPLTLVDVTWEASRNSIQKPREWSLSLPWRSIPFNPHKAAIALFLGEFLFRALRNEAANPSLFRYIHSSLEWFDECDEHFSNFHIVFLLHLSRFLGFYPNADDWHEGDYFDLQNAVFTSSVPLHKHYLQPEEAALVPKFLRMDVRKMRVVHLNGALRSRTLSSVVEFYRLHVPEFPEIKSLNVLAEVFS